MPCCFLSPCLLWGGKRQGSKIFVWSSARVRQPRIKFSLCGIEETNPSLHVQRVCGSSLLFVVKE